MDEARLSRWIGRSEEKTDHIRLQPAHFMEMTLDRAPGLREGDPLPPLWHWLYFLETAPLGGLGRDGHPARGGFLPPVPLPRRMWAGGRVAFPAPLRIGAEARRLSTIDKVVAKEGRSGALCFVTLRHEVSCAGTLCIREEHDIVYREDPKPGDPPPSAAPSAPPSAPSSAPPPEEDYERSETVEPSAVQLFRYSALTFNGHRIHYDRDYATEVEGHAGLVFHGPLTATLLADFALRLAPGCRLTRFDYRALSPLYDTAAFSIHGSLRDEGASLAALNPEARLAMTARAAFAA